MLVFLKDNNGLSIGKTTSVFKVEHEKQPAIYKDTKLELEAIAILLGWYNKYGRKIPLDQWNEIELEFEEILRKIKQAIA